MTRAGPERYGPEGEGPGRRAPRKKEFIQSSGGLKARSVLNSQVHIVHMKPQNLSVPIEQQDVINET